MKLHFSKAVFLAVIMVLYQTAHAATSMPYQGHLTDPAGQDLNGTVSMEVRIYDSFIGGTGEGITNSHVIYAESHSAVNVSDGVFRIGIGEGASLDPKWAMLPVDDIIEKERAYLELWVDGEKLSPRQRLGSLPAAVHAERAKFVDELDSLPAITEDMIPNYSAERITSGTFTSSQIPNLDASKIDGALVVGHIPPLDVGKFSTSGTIPVDRLAHSYSATKITTGEVDITRLPSASFLVMGDFAFGTGTLTHGQHLSLPSGFISEQCNIVFSPTETAGAVEGIDCQRTYLNGSNNLECEVWQKSDCSGDKANCSAMFMAVCKREG